MRGIINYFIKNSFAANAIMIGLLIIGIISGMQMKSTFFPDIPDRIIFVQTVLPGASPEEIEEGIINKIEEKLKGITGIEQITSVSNENTGSVTIEVKKKADAYIVVEDVKNAVNSIPSFPAGMEPPKVFVNENLGFAISFAISGAENLQKLKEVARKAEDDLLAMDGISKVRLSGFPDEEIVVECRERDLRAYQLTFAEISAAVRAANIDITGGKVKAAKEEILLRARQKEYYANDLRNIVVKKDANGGKIYLHQVADVRDQWVEDNPSRSFLDGAPSVVINISNTPKTEDMITITDMVKSYVADFNEREDLLEATVVRDGSITLKQRINLLTENGLLGFALVIVLLAMFLHWRIAFWVALAIPICFGGMFIFANYLDVTINVVSLFGMIVVIGILVDDGIVIAENIYQKYEKGYSRVRAAVEGTLEVLPAIFTAIITTIIAFSAFFFIDGTLGDFFVEMSIVVIFSLVFSLIEGAIILPTHVAHSKALTKKNEAEPKGALSRLRLFFDRLMDGLRDKIYAPVLKFTLHNKFLSIAFMVCLLMLTFGAINGGLIKGTFFPNIERDNVTINLKMPSGTNPDITMQWLQHIEQSAWRANDSLTQQFFNGEKQPIERIERNLGPSTYQGSINIALLPGENRDSLRLRKILNTIREFTGDIDNAEELVFGSQSAFGKPVSISLVGEDYEELNAATRTVKQRMSKLEELIDVTDNNQEGLKEINLELSEKGAFLGLNTQFILNQVRQGFFGAEVQRIQRGRDEVKVWVRYAEADRSDISNLLNMRIRLGNGVEYPLSELADVSIGRGVVSINHLNGKREIRIESEISNDNVSVSDITASLKNDIIPEILEEYPSVSALFEGQNREQEKSQNSMAKIMPILLGLMVFCIALTFRSIMQTLAVFLLIPFAFIGVAWGHWAVGIPISLFSVLGIIALIGILVNDALVFVATYNNNLQDGQKQMDALVDAGLSRFRPIILTSITTFAGLFPLLLEKSLQAQFLKPMAVSVSFGLLLITVIILLMLPVFLVIVNRVKYYVASFFGKTVSYESVEPSALNLDGLDDEE
ncbi:MAG: efflux RND transporter permease subunit [Saprospiraceae bacterium]|nr:efflux RND transporter permease subunit [Saprospiraceae bacterium]